MAFLCTYNKLGNRKVSTILFYYLDPVWAPLFRRSAVQAQKKLVEHAFFCPKVGQFSCILLTCQDQCLNHPANYHPYDPYRIRRTNSSTTNKKFKLPMNFNFHSSDDPYIGQKFTKLTSIEFDICNYISAEINNVVFIVMINLLHFDNVHHFNLLNGLSGLYEAFQFQWPWHKGTISDQKYPSLSSFILQCKLGLHIKNGINNANIMLWRKIQQINDPIIFEVFKATGIQF